MDTTTNSAIFFQTFLYNSYNQHYKKTHFNTTKLLQKREMRKDIVIELSYKGFSRASDYS